MAAKQKLMTVGEVILLIASLVTIFASSLDKPVLFALLLLIPFITSGILLYNFLKGSIFYLSIIMVSLIFITLLYLNFSGFFRDDISIKKIEIAEDRCLWLNNYDKNDITGFKENSVYLWNKWRWYPSKDLKHNIYSGTTRDTRLRLIYTFLKDDLQKNLENLSNSYIKENEINLSIIKDSTYFVFLKCIVDNYLKGGNFLSFIKSVWPKEYQINMFKGNNLEKWSAFKDFEYDFFREKHPIFDIIIENNKDEDIVVDRASFEMKNLIVDTRPKAYGGTTLKSAADYTWVLSNLEDMDYTKWLLDLNKKNPYGFKEEYKEKLNDSKFKLVPDPIFIPKKSFGRYSIIIVDGYLWECDIKFVFHTLKNENIESQWYRFIPTSHPSFNLYSYD